MTSISFLAPFFLATGILFLVPLIIHLFNRHRAVKVSFSAMEFLLKSHKKVERRFRFKQFLLLLLRVLLVLVLALAFAKPFVKRASNTASKLRPKAIAVLFDDSVSMKAMYDGKTAFEKARKKVFQWLKTLRGEDQVALFAFSKSGANQSLAWSFDKNQMKKILSDWKATNHRGTLSSSLEKAIQQMEKKKGFSPEIWVFSDMAKHSFSDNLLLEKSTIPIRFIPVLSDKREISNVSIQHVEVRNSSSRPSFFKLLVTIKNWDSKQSRKTESLLFLNGSSKARSVLTLEPHSAKTQIFYLKLKKAGFYEGYVEINSDAYLPDNRYYFAFQAQKKPSVLLVNGSPQQTPYLDELFYVEKALREQTSPFQLQTCNADRLCPLPTLEKFQVVLLANVGSLPVPWLSQLKQFVKKGGGCFLSVGDQIRSENFNQMYDELLPNKLRSTSLAAQSPDGTGVSIFRNLGEIQEKHFIFRELYQSGIHFQSAQVTKLMLTEPNSNSSQQSVLWKFSHGPPALLENSVEKGKVLLFTTTLDKDWTDFPIRTAFLPWLTKSLEYLAGGTKFELSRSFALEEQASVLKLAGKQVLAKSQKEQFWLRKSHLGWNFPVVQEPGIFHFFQKGKRVQQTPVVYNVSREESDLSPISFQKMKENKNISVEKKLLPVHSERIWPFLFLLVLLLFCLESSIVRWL